MSLHAIEPTRPRGQHCVTQVIRPDDTEEAIKRRLQQYHDLAKPLIAHYGAKVATFAGTESDVIYPVMKKHVEDILGV